MLLSQPVRASSRRLLLRPEAALRALEVTCMRTRTHSSPDRVITLVCPQQAASHARGCRGRRRWRGRRRGGVHGRPCVWPATTCAGTGPTRAPQSRSAQAHRSARGCACEQGEGLGASQSMPELSNTKKKKKAQAHAAAGRCSGPRPTTFATMPRMPSKTVPTVVITPEAARESGA
jgi:hypothetical protein